MLEGKVMLMENLKGNERHPLEIVMSSSEDNRCSSESGVISVRSWLILAGDDVPSSKTLSDSVERGVPFAQRYEKASLSWERRLRLG